MNTLHSQNYKNHLSYLISKSIIYIQINRNLKIVFTSNFNINIGPPIKYEKMIKYNKF